MLALRTAQLIEAGEGRAVFQLERGWRCEVALLDDGLGRVLCHPPGGLREPRTWAIAGGLAGGVPWEGRSRTGLFAARARWGGDLTRIAISRADVIGLHLGWRPLMPVTQYAAAKPRSHP